MAYRVRLLDDLLRIYNVFHPWLLYLYKNNPLPGQTRDLDPLVVLEEDETEYKVESVLDLQLDMT
jgi:hypothetical protein